MTTRRRPRPLAVAGEILLWPAAALGLLCVVLAALGAGLGFQVVLFSSGSMSPTIPAGSAALVRTVTAADLRPGDVVTVERDGGRMPVTHRVVEVAAADGDPAARTLTLQGDANAQVDAETYRVTEAGRVVASVPGVAGLVARLGDPRVLAPVGAAAAALVVWGLWPRRPSRAAATGTGTSPVTRPETIHATSAQGAGVLALVVPLALAGVVATPTPAGANTGDEHVVQGQYLRLTSVAGDGADRLSPGDSTDWAVGVAADAGDGTVARTLRVDGALAAHVRVAVESCPERWSGSGCAPGARTLVAPTAVAPGDVVDLGGQDARDERWLRVRVTLPADAPESAQALAGTLTLRAAGSGESVAVTPGGGPGGGPGDEPGDVSGASGSGGTGSGGTGVGAGGGEGSAPAGAGAGEVSATGGPGWAADVPGWAAGVPGALPRTGADLAPWLALALMAVLVGAALRAGRRATEKIGPESGSES
ncbi:signal peptidase I [Isoptericola sp. NPDC019693]|uniref:signal peptidase I n=1 Tax=Isoptericola sp. NPDC019693 TaxID=3364009 RepID=UPI0037B2622B